MTWNARLLSICSVEEFTAVVRTLGIEADAALTLAQREQKLVIKLGSAERAICSLPQALDPLGGCVIIGEDKPSGSEQAACLLITSAAGLLNIRNGLSAQPDPELRRLGMELDAIIRSTQPPANSDLVVRSCTFRWGERTYIMGIVNATPDSFSGDGLLQEGIDAKHGIEHAVLQSISFIQAGADILDVGGESTRPGAHAVEAGEELERILPVIQAIRIKSDIPISVDTTKAVVAEAALQAGADIINDISGLSNDTQMAPLAATRKSPVVLMHNNAGAARSARMGQLGGHFTSAQVHSHAALDALMADIVGGLRTAVDTACRAGVARERLIIDPGIGFGKTREENLYIINHLDELKSLDLPILLGVSRKAFIGYTLDTTVNERIEGTAAAVCVGIMRGTDIIRVHDVKQMVRVARMTDALVRFTPPQEGE